jgi:beta-glucuronidase
MKTIVSAFVVLLLAFMVTGPSFARDMNIVKTRGTGKVHLVQYEDGSWQLIVDSHPYVVKGMEYSPDPVGSSPEESNEWMCQDLNNNGRADGPYDAWVDKNRDNFQDADEDAVGDFALLKEMGCNTIRIYNPDTIDKSILRDLYDNYGIRIIMGSFFGAYAKCSGAAWSEGTDYTNAEQRARMLEEVRQMVLEYKDEPYILMWMLGNENDAEGTYENSTFNNTNATREPKAYAELLNEVSKTVHKLDPNHPVGVCSATFKLLHAYAEYAPEIDVIGMNNYPGPYGFGTLWNHIKGTTDRPVLITEYGTDSFNQVKEKEDENFQALFHRRAWNDIMANSYWGKNAGNAIGGVVFCWLDKWWLCGNNKVHDVEAGARRGPKPDGWVHDEWMGMCGQGNGTRSPFMRQPRKAYYLYKDELWNTPLPDVRKTLEEGPAEGNNSVEPKPVQ